MKPSSISTEINKGNYQAALEMIEECLKQEPENASYLNMLGVCYFYLKKHEKGLRLLEKSLKLKPDDPNFMFNAGSCYRIGGQFEKAEFYLKKALAIKPDSHLYLGAIAHAYTGLKDFKKAKEAGKKCLIIKDKLASLEFNRQYKDLFKLNDKKPIKGYQKNDVNIIAFSLWGDNPLYTHGAVNNAMITSYIYPEWRARFYVDKSVPKNIIKLLENYGAQIAFFDSPKLGYYKLFWRFLTSDDENVTRFICRDCDSRLNMREKLAVDAWVNSGKLFHIMRDSYANCELILAGMWGGVSGVLPDMVQMIEVYKNTQHEKWIDQNFLKDIVWPMIKNESLAHDDFFRFYHADKFPLMTIDPQNRGSGGVAHRTKWDLNRLIKHE